MREFFFFSTKVYTHFRSCLVSNTNRTLVNEKFRNFLLYAGT
jgi:hypothetical protein